MRPIWFALLLAMVTTFPAFSQEQAADTLEPLGLEEVIDNLDPTKNTDLHVKEYWKSIKGQELVSTGEVLEVKPKSFGRDGATITLFNGKRAATQGVNIVLDTLDVSNAAKLSRNDIVKFRGILNGFKRGRGECTRLSLTNSEILDRTPGVAKPAKISAPERPKRTSRRESPSAVAAPERDPGEKSSVSEAPSKAQTSRPPKAQSTGRGAGSKKGGSFWDRVGKGLTQGVGSARRIDGNTYSIEVSADIVTGSAGNMYVKWDETAKEACGGRGYKTISQQVVNGVEGHSDRLIGTISCQ